MQDISIANSFAVLLQGFYGCASCPSVSLGFMSNAFTLMFHVLATKVLFGG